MQSQILIALLFINCVSATWFSVTAYNSESCTGNITQYSVFRSGVCFKDPDGDDFLKYDLHGDEVTGYECGDPKCESICFGISFPLKACNLGAYFDTVSPPFQIAVPDGGYGTEVSIDSKCSDWIGYQAYPFTCNYDQEYSTCVNGTYVYGTCEFNFNYDDCTYECDTNVTTAVGDCVEVDGLYYKYHCSSFTGSDASNIVVQMLLVISVCLSLLFF